MRYNKITQNILIINKIKYRNGKLRLKIIQVNYVNQKIMRIKYQKYTPQVMGKSAEKLTKQVRIDKSWRLIIG